MGDRASIGIVHRSYDREAESEKIDAILYCYFHWAGKSIRELTIAAVEAAQGRWEDPDYANRIALRTFFADYDGSTGAGFALYPQDSDVYNWFLIDWKKQEVAVMPVESYYLTLEAKLDWLERGKVRVIPFAEIHSLPTP